MIRALQTLSISALICGGAVFVHCAVKWIRCTPGIEPDPKLAIVHQFRQAGGADDRGGRVRLSPLVGQAQAFASYLRPPKPPKAVQTPRATLSAKKTIAPVKLPETTAKFTLIATSYYHAMPEKSLALISEPGRGTHRWVGPGARLGHFILEKVEQGSIVYRDGERLGQMAVVTKIPVRHQEVQQITLASGQTEAPPPKPSAPRKPRKTRPRRAMQRLGPVRPEAPLLARDHVSTNG